DHLSISHLSAIGIATDRVPVTADVAFILAPAPANRVDAILSAESIVRDDRPLLGVSLSPVLRKRYEKNGRGSFATLMANVLDDFSQHHGVRVFFVPHVTGPTPQADDRLVAHEVAGLMREPCAIVRGDYRPDELKA